MSWNGLRGGTEVTNYTYGPGRTNILADPSQQNETYSPSNSISSIGHVQTNGLGQVAASENGPGTLKSTNIQVGGGTGKQVAPPDSTQMGATMQNEKRSQFVDYRQTDPMIIENLRKNPLSIYAVGDAKNAKIPEFFSYIRPDDYGSYVNTTDVPISDLTKEMSIDGSPQTTILGLGEHNPFMGITSRVHNTVSFPGKTYGGNNNGSAESAAVDIYSQGWTNNFGNYKSPDKCQNKALDFSAPGYNISSQINQGDFVQNGPYSNLPWGPRVATGDPQTQIGGIWNSGTNPGSLNANNWDNYFKIPVQKQVNNYKDGLPGSLVSS
jgi:hypothetical protein